MSRYHSSVVVKQKWLTVRFGRSSEIGRYEVPREEPKTLVLLQLLILLITWSVVNVTADINDFRFISQHTIRVSREEVCLPSFDVVNCLLK